MKIRLIGLFIAGALTFVNTEVLASKYGYLVLDAKSLEGEDPKTIVLARVGLSMSRSDELQLSTGNPFIKLEAGHYKFLRVDISKSKRIDYSKSNSINSKRLIATDIDFFVYQDRINYLGEFVYDPSKKKHKDRLKVSDDTGLLKATCKTNAEDFKNMPVRFSMSNMPKQDFELECEGFVIKPIES